jgi:hypothetical protein
VKAHLKTMNWPAFIITGFLVCYALMSISDNIYIKIAAIPIGLFVEYQVQEIWGLSFAYKEAGRRYGWLRGVYIWYLVIFGLSAGIGLVLTEINNQKDIVKQEIKTKSNMQSDINRINREINGLIIQRDREGQTGTGEKYQYLQGKIEEAKKELNKLNPKREQLESKIQSKDMYVNLERETGIPKIWLVGITIGTALAIVYLGLMLRPMKVTIETGKSTLQLEALNKNCEHETHIETNSSNHSDINKIPVTIPAKERYCQYSKCGKILPKHLRSDAKYCDDDCRLASFREERKNANTKSITI